MQHLRSRVRAIILGGLVVVLAMALVPTATAHPADMYFQTHTVRLTPEGITLDWVISPGTLLSLALWEKTDVDGDGVVSTDEALAWLEPHAAEYLLIVDMTPLTWVIDSISWPDSLLDFEVGDQMIEVQMHAPWPQEHADAPQIALYNRYQEFNSNNWFAIRSDDGIEFYAPQQEGSAVVFHARFPGGQPPDPALLTDSTPRTYWDSGTPALIGGVAVVPRKPPAPKSTSSSTLTRLIREENLSIGFYLTAFAIALGLGSLHALTPGHGKALVGAYLVGSRGTIRHAIALGSIVTITHTGSVLALGFLTLAASHILLPTTLFPILEMASGLLVVAMGAGLMLRRWKAWQSVRQARQRRAQPAPAPVAQAASGGGQRIQINAPIRVNVYNEVLPQQTVTLGNVNWRALVTLGISGGLVPCPDAIAILLVAVAINRIVLGLSLIVAFSLGLAGILTGIGIAMVRSRRLFEGLNAFNRLVPAMPLISALVVTGLGVGLTINAARGSTLFAEDTTSSDRLDFRVGSELGGDAEQPDAASDGAAPFAIEAARILYMHTDENNRYQLFVTPATNPDPRPITAAPYGVWDYRLAPDGRTLVYSAPREYGGSDLWQIDVDGSNPRRVLACPEAACTRATWSPDGTQLIYERLDAPTPAAPQGISSLWWLRLDSGETGPLFSDSQLQSFNPVWSPDGQWLSYVVQGSASVQMYNLLDGSSRVIPSQTGGDVVWSPDATAMVLSDVREVNGQVFTHLLRYDLASATLTDLTGEDEQGDTGAAWSPDGQWIAMVRRIYSGPDASLGDQIWLMRADGTEAFPLTEEPDIVHGTPVWSPDGAYLVFEQFPVAGSDAQPGIWMIAIESRTLTRVAEKGNYPAWLP